MLELPRRHAQPREGEECESETLIIKREHSTTCQAVIEQSNWSTSQHWSIGQSQQSTLLKTAKLVK